VQCAPNPLPKNEKQTSIVNLKYQSHFWLISCSVFLGGRNFLHYGNKKKQKKIHCKLPKGIFGGKIKNKKIQHILRGKKKRLEVAYFTQRAPGQNWAGSQKVFYFPV
jgi:hypothetical protein